MTEENKTAEVYISYDDAGNSQMMWVRPSNATEHKEKYNMNADNSVCLGIIHNNTPDVWPKDAPFKPEDVECHKIVNRRLTFCKQKATDFHKNRIRGERDFSNLDLEMMRAIEQNKPLDQISRKKQKLRDVTSSPLWDKCQTLQDFKNITLEALLSTTNQ